jgi:polyhydroxybutyrate depolymerase
MTTRRRVAALLVVAALGLGACTSAASDTTAPTNVRPATARCRAERVAPGRSVVTVTSGARERSYIRYVPKGLDASAPAPLVVDLTAYSPATMEESFSGFTKPDADGKVKADAVGAVVVTPEPVNGKGLLTWNVNHTAGWTDDEAFLTALIHDAERAVCIDAKRVFVMGFAIGGVMASALACDRPDLITAIAAVSGLWDPPDCRPSQPTAVLTLHGNDDHFLPYTGGVGDRIGNLNLSPETSGGLAVMATRPAAPAAATAWAKRNGCAATPNQEAAATGVTETRWTGCRAAVELYTIDGGSHTWPGSIGMGAYESLLGAPSKAIGANGVIWDFFERSAR